MARRVGGAEIGALRSLQAATQPGAIRHQPDAVADLPVRCDLETLVGAVTDVLALADDIVLVLADRHRVDHVLDLAVKQRRPKGGGADLAAIAVLGIQGAFGFQVGVRDGRAGFAPGW